MSRKGTTVNVSLRSSKNPENNTVVAALTISLVNWLQPHTDTATAYYKQIHKEQKNFRTHFQLSPLICHFLSISYESVHSHEIQALQHSYYVMFQLLLHSIGQIFLLYHCMLTATEQFTRSVKWLLSKTSQVQRKSKHELILPVQNWMKWGEWNHPVVKLTPEVSAI